MPQSLLATFALVFIATSTLGLNVRHLNIQRQTYTREIHEMGSSTIIEVMEFIRARTFDRALDLGLNTSTPDNFTFNNSTEHFVKGAPCRVLSETGTRDCRYIDDFHKQEVVRPFVLGLDTVFFKVNIDVKYVDDQFEPASGRTFHKQVTISVQDVWPKTNGKPFLATPIRLSRVFSYKS